MYNYFEIKSFFLSGSEGLPGSPGVKTSPSHAGGAGSLVGIPGWIPRGMPDWREKIPHWDFKKKVKTSEWVFGHKETTTVPPSISSYMMGTI